MVSKRNRFAAFISFVVLLSMLLLTVGCAGTPAASPTAAPAAPTQAPAAQPTKAPAAEPTKAPAAGPIKIGALIPFTGLETHNGLSMKYGAEIAGDEVNEAGGILGRKVEFVWEDTTGVPDVAVQKAQKLMKQDKVDVIIGTLSSAERAAVFAVTTPAKMLFMNPTFYEAGLCNRYYFSTGASPNQTIDPLAEYAVKTLGKKTFYMVASDYVWGTGSVAASKAALASLGAQVVGEEYAAFGTTDFSAIVQRIGAAKPDVVWPYVAGQDGITFLKQLTDAGVRKNVTILGDYLDELITPALTNEQAAGIVNTSTYYMGLDNPKNKDFIAKLKKKDPNALMGNFGMEMYYNVRLYAQAAQKAGAIDTEKIVDALKGSSFDGPAGKVQFTTDNQHAIQDVYLAVVQPDKTFKIINKYEQVAPKFECKK